MAVKQESSESVPVFISCACEALHFLQSTRPPAVPLSRPASSDPVYLLEDSDRELLISVLLQGTKYSALTTSLLAQSKLTVQQVEDALKNEEAHKTRIVAAAAAASTPAAPASTSRRSNKPKCICTFCGRNGHAEKCYKLEEAKKAKEDTGSNFGKGKANSAHLWNLQQQVSVLHSRPS